MPTEAEASLVGELYERFDKGDVDGAFELLHPDAELHQNPEFPDASIYRGREEFRRGMNVFLEEWEGFRFDPLETAVGERIWIRVAIGGRGKASGVPAQMEVFHVWEIRDDKPFRCTVYLGEDDARAAAGLDR